MRTKIGGLDVLLFKATVDAVVWNERPVASLSTASTESQAASWREAAKSSVVAEVADEGKRTSTRIGSRSGNS